MTQPNLSPASEGISEAPAVLELHTHDSRSLATRLAWLEAYASRGGQVPLSRHPGWLNVLEKGLGHTPFCLEAVEDGKTCGLLPLAYVRSLLFGRFLVGLPYLNYGGVIAEKDTVACQLIDGAVELADRLGVRYLELRQEKAVPHAKLVRTRTHKVHMRLELPPKLGTLWDQLPSKVRNQVRKGQKGGLTVAWGTHDVLPEFYAVFSHNMRDLGTPAYGKKLFTHTLGEFPGRAEICVVRAGTKSIAAGMLLHGWSVTEVPSASSLRAYNPTCANMLLYWSLLERAVQRGQSIFDFGRSSQDSSTFHFKKQWGAAPHPAEWQCYARSGSSGDLRPDNPRYGKMVRLWKKLPLVLTRLIGPAIVRGIP